MPEIPLPVSRDSVPAAPCSSGAVQVVADTATAGAFLRRLMGTCAHRGAAPLLREGRVIGIARGDFAPARRAVREEMALLKTFATSGDRAIENAPVQGT
jgi:hypothetical protein